MTVMCGVMDVRGVTVAIRQARAQGQKLRFPVRAAVPGVQRAVDPVVGFRRRVPLP